MEISDLISRANIARQNILKMTTACRGGHLAGSLSCIDILIALYFRVLNHRPRDPGWEHRDRFVMSKGHGAPAFYTALAMSGYFPEKELFTLRKIDSRLQGHPDSKKLPGIEISTGSLGQGLSAAVGMALGKMMDDSIPPEVFCLMGDGECDEGQVWEAAMFASHNDIDNITAIIDRNGYQIDGKTEDVLGLEPFGSKWKSFGWNAVEIDGHRMADIVEALENSRGERTVVIADTVKGKGVSFLENNNAYHSKPCSKDDCEMAVKELEEGLSEIKGGL
jgi:transketolase